MPLSRARMYWLPSGRGQVVSGGRGSRGRWALRGPRLRWIGPCVAAAAVLGDGDRADAVAHAAGIEKPVEVVDLMGDEAGHAVVEGEDVLAAVGAGAGDLGAQRARGAGAGGAEGQGTPALVVRLGGLAGHP